MTHFMSNATRRVLLILCLSGLGATGTISFAQKESATATAASDKIETNIPENFSVTATLRDIGGTETKTQVKIYRLGAKYRAEIKSPQGLGPDITMIVDTESEKNIQLMEADKLYSEMSYNPEVVMLFELDKMAEEEGVTISRQGEKEVEGQKTIEYEITDSSRDLEILAYLNKENGFPVLFKNEAEKEEIVLSEFSGEAPDKALFEVPEDFRDMNSIRTEEPAENEAKPVEAPESEGEGEEEGSEE